MPALFFAAQGCLRHYISIAVTWLCCVVRCCFAGDLSSVNLVTASQKCTGGYYQDVLLTFSSIA